MKKHRRISIVPMNYVYHQSLKSEEFVFHKTNEHSDPLITEVVNKIAEFANTLKPRKAAPNLGKEERIALEWLKDNTRNKNLAVLKADKGELKYY